MNKISHVKSDDALSDEIKQHAERIGESWHKAAQSIIDTGQYILDAEDSLSGDDYDRLKEHLISRAGLSGPTISKLRTIARNKVLTKEDNVRKLPPSYATIYELAGIKDRAKLTAAFVDDKIHPELERNEVKEIFSPKQPSTKAPARDASMDIKIQLMPKAETIPEDVTEQLEYVLQELSQYFDVKATGLTKWR